MRKRGGFGSVSSCSIEYGLGCTNVSVSSIVVSGEVGGGGCGGSGCLLSFRVCVRGGVIGADDVCGWSSLGKLKVTRFCLLGGVVVVSFWSICLKNFEFRVTWWSVRLQL